MEQLDKYKARIKRHNEAVKEKYDRVSATLPKGTIDRIKALNMSVNAAINDSLLVYLDELERSQPDTLPKAPKTEAPAADQTRQAVTDEEALKIWRQRVAENEAKKKASNEMPPEPEPVQEEEPEQIGFTAARMLDIIHGGKTPEENQEKSAARAASINRAESEEK